MNMAIGELYKSGYWLASSKGTRIGKLLFSFLGHYSVCARICLQNRKRRFALTPKHHMIAHDAHGLLAQSSQGGWAENPMSRTNQLQEDFIGRPARISRRVAPRSIHKSVMLRALVNYNVSFVAAGKDKRGLDGYPQR